MAAIHDPEAVADACMAAHIVVGQHGTPEMLALSRTLLLVIGQEIAGLMFLPPPAGQSTPDDDEPLTATG